MRLEQLKIGDKFKFKKKTKVGLFEYKVVGENGAGIYPTRFICQEGANMLMSKSIKLQVVKSIPNE